MTAPAPAEPHELHLGPLDSPVGIVLDAQCACGVWGCAFLLTENTDRDDAERQLAVMHARHLIRVRA